jgi:hypothetical protein
MIMRLKRGFPWALSFLVRTTGGVALVLAMAMPAAAQEWTEYQNVQDGFKIVFPGQPKVTETTYESAFDYTLPARVYTAEKGREKYTVTVVDYSGIEQMGIARRKACPPGAEPCIGSDLSGPGYWRHDVRGALVYASSKLIERDAKLTHYMWNHQDLVEGHEIQLTNADQSRTYAFVGMHDMKLYIVEGTVPKGYPVPALFQSALGFVDKDGNGVRYQTIYDNKFYGLKELPPPPRAGRGGRGGGRGGGARGAGAGTTP